MKPARRWTGWPPRPNGCASGVFSSRCASRGCRPLRCAGSFRASRHFSAITRKIEVRLITASTAAEQFQMEADIVLSGPARRPGWISERFMGEARLPLLSADLMTRRPLRRPADLARHTLLHSETLPDARPRWLAANGITDLAPERDQAFEHFYFAIQAALDGLGVMMGPIALVGKELQSGRLVMPWPEPALRSRGYFIHTPQSRRNAPAIAALRRWLLHAG